jgi:hypothetical protein
MISRHREYGGAIPRNGSQTFARSALTNVLAESRHPVRSALGAPVRQKQFQNDTARRQVDQIEGMIADLERTTRVLEVEIRAEEDRTGIHDPAHFAYSTYAKSTTARRDTHATAARRVEHRAPDAPMLSATG